LTVTYLIAGDISDYDKYRIGFLVLGIPVVICLTLLLIAKFKYPHPEVFEKDHPEEEKKTFNKPFIFLLIGSALMALGFVDFPLFTAHVSSLNIIDNNYLPLVYSFAMLMDALSALIFGILYDKKGFSSLVIATLISSPFCFFFMYFGQLWSVLIGAALWGIGMGAQESVMLSAVTDLSSKDKRGKAFSVFDIIFGLFWFLGSILTGWLCTANKLAMCLVSLLLVFSAAILYICSAISVKKEKISK
jgi:MFS family permease